MLVIKLSQGLEQLCVRRNWGSKRKADEMK